MIYDTRGWIGSGEAYVRCMELYQHYMGTGFTSRPLPFDIPLMCDPEIRVSYTIAGLYDDKNHSVLKNSAGRGLAKGVGVQLLKDYGDQAPIQLGQKMFFGTSGPVGGNQSIPLVARYYQTENAVSAGKVNILAFFNLFYE